jgi:hypothetical protein
MDESGDGVVVIRRDDQWLFETDFPESESGFYFHWLA